MKLNLLPLILAASVASTTPIIAGSGTSLDAAANLKGSDSNAGWHFDYLPGLGVTLGDNTGYYWFTDQTIAKTNKQETFRLPTAVPTFDGPLLLAFRMQDKYLSTAQDAKPVDLNYSRTNGQDALQVHGAAILDTYLGFVNQGKLQNDMYLKLTLAFDWQKDPSGSSIQDNRTYYAGLEINPEILNGKQLVKAGIAYEQDALTGKHNWAPTLRIDPSLFGYIGRRVGDDMETDPGSSLASKARENYQGVFLHRRTWNVYFRPNFGLKTSAGGDLKTMQDLSDLNLIYGLETGVNLFDDRVVLNYTLSGVDSIKSGGTNHINHEVSLHLKPDFHYHKQVTDSKYLGDRTGTFGSDWSLFVSYASGEDAPTYVKQNQFKVGLGFRL